LPSVYPGVTFTGKDIRIQRGLIIKPGASIDSTEAYDGSVVVRQISIFDSNNVSLIQGGGSNVAKINGINHSCNGTLVVVNGSATCNGKPLKKTSDKPPVKEGTVIIAGPQTVIGAGTRVKGTVTIDSSTLEDDAEINGQKVIVKKSTIFGIILGNDHEISESNIAREASVKGQRIILKRTTLRAGADVSGSSIRLDGILVESGTGVRGSGINLKGNTAQKTD
jgi:hypothetical protein